MSDHGKTGGDRPSNATEPVHDAVEPDSQPLDPVVQAHIGRELRSLFDGIVHEPVPDRFLQLLQKLEQKKMDPA